MQSQNQSSTQTSLPGKGIFLIFLLVFFTAFFLSGVYAYLYSSLQLSFLLIGGAAYSYFLAWSLRQALIVTYDGITYRTLLRSVSLSWPDIASISTEMQSYGSYGEPVMLITTSNNSKKAIKFNYMYFRRAQLHYFLNTILMNCPLASVDKGTVDYLARSKKAFAKKVVAA